MKIRAMVQVFLFVLAILGIASVCGAVDWKGAAGKVADVLFSERSRFAKPVQPAREPAALEPPTDREHFDQIMNNLETAVPVAPKDLDSFPYQAFRPADSAHKVRWAPPPPGFMTAETFNYLIYREAQAVTPRIKTLLDTIHGNLMLDLTPFTILIKPNKILVMLFDRRASYAQFTKLPSWSGASSDLRADTMYVVEDNSFYGLTVHELTHLYFDGYFLPTISPLWLSEGMAVYMQVHATKARPNWLDAGLERILSGELIAFDEMTSINTLSGYDTASAELWYSQSYSVVDYLLNNHTRDEFYTFCNEIKAGSPLHQALYRAYGLPFTKVSVLENVWLHDLQKAGKQGFALAASAQATSRPRRASEQAASAQAPSRPRRASAPSAVQPATPGKTKINKLQLVPTNGYKGGF